MTSGLAPARGEAPHGGTTAPPGLLAVIDMQRVFAEPDSPWAAPRFDEAATGVRRLLPAFGERTVFTRFIAPERPEGAWRAYYDRWSFALRPPEARLWQLVDEFTGDARHSLDAPAFGKWGPDLAARLGTDGRLVLAGVSTDCCVLSTALGPVAELPPAPRRHARTLAAPGPDPSTSSTWARARHTESTHLTPQGPPFGRTTGV